MALMGADGKPVKWLVQVEFEPKTGVLRLNRDDGTTPTQALWLLERAAFQILQMPPDPAIQPAAQMPPGRIPQ